MQVPTGSILLWFGSVASIPSGWILCDGNGGSPDLRDNFVRGAGGAFAVDDTGGSSTHLHSFVGDGHSHVIPAGAGLQAGANFTAVTADGNAFGNTNASSSIPPFHALAYIMKT